MLKQMQGVGGGDLQRMMKQIQGVGVRGGMGGMRPFGD